MEHTSMCDAALQYAKMGFLVFPLVPRGKRPLTKQGFKDATLDTKQIKAWWKENPKANIGIATGNGIVVLDFDVDEDKGINGYHILTEWERENGKLPETVISITGRGGYHYIYRTDKECKSGVGIYEGVDIRGEGGYIVVPPSVHENGRTYEWEQPPDEFPIAQADELVEKFLSVGYQEKREYFSSPEIIPEGQRNATLYKMACSLRAKGYAETAIWAAVKAENEAKCQPSLNDNEIDKIIESALKYESGTSAEFKDKKDNKNKEKQEGRLDRFHLLNDKGKIAGVFDFAIFEYIKENYDIFILGGTPYIYENGVFVEDDTGAKLKTIIRGYIYPTFIKSTTIKRIYELFIAAAELEVAFEDVNQYPAHWINFKNSFFDPKAKNFIAHDPKYKAINQVPHIYNPNNKLEGMTVDRWLNFVFEVEDDREMFLQYAGYCLNRDVSQQKFLIFVGEGGSGKSTSIRMVEAMTGSKNISNISLSELQQRFASHGLMGKLVNSCADLEIAALEDTNTLKKCLGEDTLRGERKGHDAVSFKSYAKLIFSTNELPLVKNEKTNGFFRRLLVLGMNKLPKDNNPDLPNVLIKEIDYFTQLCVEALERMYENKIIKISANSERAVAQLRCDSDTVQAFLMEECSEDAGSRIERTKLFEKYAVYCKNSERQSLTRNNFYKSLRLKRYKEIKTGGIFVFEGISLSKNCSDLPQEITPEGFIDIPEGVDADLPFE